MLNTLEAGTVEAEKDGQDIEVNGVTISSNVKYNYITSGKSYAYAINNKLNTNNNGTQSSGSIVELGEKLYNGDLKKADNGDEGMDYTVGGDGVQTAGERREHRHEKTREGRRH